MTFFETTIHYAIKFSKIISPTNNSKLNFFLKVSYTELLRKHRNRVSKYIYDLNILYAYMLI